MHTIHQDPEEFQLKHGRWEELKVLYQVRAELEKLMPTCSGGKRKANEMPPIELNQYYTELAGFLLTLLVGLAIKDWATGFIKGSMFRLKSSFKEGDKVILDGNQAMIVKIGLTETVFGVYSSDGYVWRYVPNERIPMLKLSKIVDPELHQDSREEKAKKIEDLLKGRDDG